MCEYCKQEVNERDEWKAKAEQAQESYLDAKHDRDAWHERYVGIERKAEGSSKVRAGSSNLEWLYEYDLDIKHAINCWVLQDGYGSAETFADAHKWLMSPHMEANGTANGTCPDAMGQASNADNCGTAEAETSQLPESDTREKLEADVRDYWYHTRGGWETAIVHEWLDRQAAITERELQAQVDDYRAEWHRACAERAELRRDLTAEKNKGIELAEQLGKAMAERDEYREKVGAMLDAAQEIRRLAEIE